MVAEVSQTLLPGPLVEQAVGLLLIDGAPSHPQLQQVLAGLAHERSRPDAEAFHDLVSIERGADGGEVLLLGQTGDPLLQLILESGEFPSPGRVLSGAVGSGEQVEAVEESSRVPDVSTKPA